MEKHPRAQTDTSIVRAADQQLIYKTQTAQRPVADDAFKDLIARHESAMQAQVRDGSHADAMVNEDLLQVIRMRAWSRLRRKDPLILDEDATFGSFLHRIARNVLNDYYRLGSRLRQHEESLEARRERIPAWEPESPESVEMASDFEPHSLVSTELLVSMQGQVDSARQHDRHAAHQLYAELAERYALDGRHMEYAALTWVHGPCRDSFILHKVFEFKHQEIARRLHTAPGTVASHIVEGRKQFVALYALVLWEDDGASDRDIARRFGIELDQVAAFLERGRNLRERCQRRAASVEEL
jgi:RNA polymerase sigma factor (sigma-70 family)